MVPATDTLFGTEPDQIVSAKIYDDADIHPDLWALAQIARVFRAIDPADRALEVAVGNWGPPSDEDFKEMLEPREVNLQYFLSEITDQSVVFDHYFYNLLSINPRSHPCTARLIALSIAVAGMVGMYYKLELHRPRPAQVLPGLFPFLPTPSHPSYPSNHATQSRTVSKLLSDAVAGTAAAVYQNALAALATRIGVNRERAGLHYASDTAAGNRLGDALADKLGALDFVRLLMDGCAIELSSNLR
ncbi:MAG: phosphatase PAP2 family protein [Pseudooceanicola sp.]|nr:phosphatase PAP2 family protein [Pseudooceanicola sp.]